MRKPLLFLIFFTIFAGNSLSYGQSEYSIQYNVTGLKTKRAFLLSINGNKYNLVDSCTVQNGMISFVKSDSLPAGMYRISFSDSLFTDVIYNYENITIQNDIRDLTANMKVITSEENRVFYAYWNISKMINDTINEIAKTGDQMYESSGYKLTPQLDSMQKKARALNIRLNKYSDSLIANSSKLLASHIINAYRTPDYFTYIKKPGAYPYKTQLDFLRDHYFDNIDITDNRLLNTEILYITITDYLNTFGDPPSTENYNRAIDTVMKRLSPNKKMYDYSLNLLLNTFETSMWEKVFVHIIDTYITSASCEIDGAQQYIAKSDAIKKLAAGNPAPPISMKDISGKTISLYETDSKVTLILFWSSDCPHCHEIMPELAALYQIWHPKGFEIFSISIDTDEKAWKAAVANIGVGWINVCDLKGFDSEVIVQYNTWRTPGFFLLDAQKKIISRPLLLSQIKEYLEKLLQ